MKKKLILLFIVLALVGAFSAQAQNLQVAVDQDNGSSAAVSWKRGGALVTVGGTFDGASVDVEHRASETAGWFTFPGLGSLTAETVVLAQLPRGDYRITVAGGGGSEAIDCDFSWYSGTAIQPSATLSGGATFIRVALDDTGAAAGDIVTWQNNTGNDILVFYAVLEVTTVATAAATVDLGYAATVVTADNLIDGQDVNASTGFFSNVTEGGTNGRPAQVVPAGEYVTGSEASGDTTDLAGYLHLGFYQIQ